MLCYGVIYMFLEFLFHFAQIVIQHPQIKVIWTNVCNLVKCANIQGVVKIFQATVDTNFTHSCFLVGLSFSGGTFW